MPPFALDSDRLDDIPGCGPQLWTLAVQFQAREANSCQPSVPARLPIAWYQHHTASRSRKRALSSA